MSIAIVPPRDLAEPPPGVDWLWLLEGVEPLDDACEALLAAADTHPDAVLLQPKLVDEHGALVLPRHWPAYGAVREVIDGAERRVLPLRAAGFHGALIRASAAHGPVTDGWTYTARLLRTGEGLLVPSATARLTTSLQPPSPRARWRAAANRDAFAPRERFDLRVQAVVARFSGGA